MRTKATNKQPTLTYVQAEYNLARFRQHQSMTNSAFLDKFVGLVESFEELGGQPGVTIAHIQAAYTTDGFTLDRTEGEPRPFYRRRLGRRVERIPETLYRVVVYAYEVDIVDCRLMVAICLINHKRLDDYVKINLRAITSCM